MRTKSSDCSVCTYSMRCTFATLLNNVNPPAHVSAPAAAPL